MIELYAGLFHDPDEAVDEVISLVEQEFRHQLLVALASASWPAAMWLVAASSTSAWSWDSPLWWLPTACQSTRPPSASTCR